MEKTIEKLQIDDFSLGFIIGVILGEGHFGGDGKQPHITLRMHVRHERIFKWLEHLIPGSKIYGPYHHGGRNYFQWMARGEALRRLVPIIERSTFKYLDPHSYDRFKKMAEEYKIPLQ